MGEVLAGLAGVLFVLVLVVVPVLLLILSILAPYFLYRIYRSGVIVERQLNVVQSLLTQAVQKADKLTEILALEKSPLTKSPFTKPPPVQMPAKVVERKGLR